jgi:thymidylate synthase
MALSYRCFPRGFFCPDFAFSKEMLWTVRSSKIFHHTHDTHHYSSSNWNERPPQTEWMIGLGGDLEIIFSFHLLEFLEFNFSNIDILKKKFKKISSSPLTRSERERERGKWA